MVESLAQFVECGTSLNFIPRCKIYEQLSSQKTETSTDSYGSEFTKVISLGTSYNKAYYSSFQK